MLVLGISLEISFEKIKVKEKGVIVLMQKGESENIVVNNVYCRGRTQCWRIFVHKKCGYLIPDTQAEKRSCLKMIFPRFQIFFNSLNHHEGIGPISGCYQLWDTWVFDGHSIGRRLALISGWCRNGLLTESRMETSFKMHFSNMWPPFVTQIGSDITSNLIQMSFYK